MRCTEGDLGCYAAAEQAWQEYDQQRAQDRSLVAGVGAGLLAAALCGPCGLLTGAAVAGGAGGAASYTASTTTGPGEFTAGGLAVATAGGAALGIAGGLAFRLAGKAAGSLISRVSGGGAVADDVARLLQDVAVDPAPPRV